MKTRLFAACLCILFLLAACSSGGDASSGSSSSASSDASPAVSPRPVIGDLLHGDVESMSYWYNGKTFPIEDTETIEEIMALVEQISFLKFEDSDPPAPGGVMYILKLEFTDGTSLDLPMPTMRFKDGEYKGSYLLYIGHSYASNVIPWPEDLETGEPDSPADPPPV